MSRRESDASDCDAATTGAIRGTAAAQDATPLASPFAFTMSRRMSTDVRAADDASFFAEMEADAARHMAGIMRPAPTLAKQEDIIVVDDGAPGDLPCSGGVDAAPSTTAMANVARLARAYHDALRAPQPVPGAPDRRVAQCLLALDAVLREAAMATLRAHRGEADGGYDTRAQREFEDVTFADDMTAHLDPVVDEEVSCVRNAAFESELRQMMLRFRS